MRKTMSPAVGLRMGATLLCLLGLVGTSACSSDTSASSAPPAAPVDWHAFDLPRKADAPPPGPTPKEKAAGDSYIAALAAPGMPGLSATLDPDSRVFAQARVWRTDSTIAIEWTMSGTQARDWMGVAATNKPVVIKGISLLWTRDEGSITDVHVVFDAAMVKAQLGVGPKELAALPAPTMASGAPQITEQSHSSEEAANVAPIHAWLDAIEHTDDTAFLAAMTDDVVVDAPEHLLSSAPGKDGRKAYFKVMHKSIGELDTRVDNVWPVGGFAVVEYSINGEQVGPLGWIPLKEDRVVRLHVIDVVQLVGGKIAHVTRYESPSEILVTG
jgi:ketosteroid isomerase-like protein